MSGFNFDNCLRNSFLETKHGFKLPNAMKTGTTIVGLIYKDGIVLGADTRATEGPIVADKNCEKIHYIAPNIYCCGAGTAADTENTTELISSQLTLHRLATGRKSRVVTACTLLSNMLFRYSGHISAALVLGGVDVTGPHLYTIYPHGSTDSLPFVTMGSGSLAAMSIFESEFRDNLDRETAMAIVEKAVSAGVHNDLGSGSNIDLCVISPETATMYRNKWKPLPLHRAKIYSFPSGTTAVLKTEVLQFAPQAKPEKTDEMELSQ
jgi:20S proteasome subunit beta 2